MALSNRVLACSARRFACATEGVLGAAVLARKAASLASYTEVSAPSSLSVLMMLSSCGSVYFSAVVAAAVAVVLASGGVAEALAMEFRCLFHSAATFLASFPLPVKEPSGCKVRSEIEVVLSLMLGLSLPPLPPPVR